MMGQPIRGGTGFFDILLDEVALMRLQDGLPTVEDSDDDGEGVEPTADQINKELFEDENDLCSTARLRMNVAMPNAAVLLEEPDVDYTVLDKEDD
jgi:hypothetical protein